MKESVFNRLRGWFEGANVMDLFAGVGSMGLEAVSRGAARVLLVEQSRSTCAILRANIDALGCGDRAEALQADALGPLPLARAPQPVQVLFLDPPYEMMEQERSRSRVLKQMARCRGLMADSSFVVLRSPVDPRAISHAVAGFDGPEVHRYNRMHVLLYAPRLGEPRSPSPP